MSETAVSRLGRVPCLALDDGDVLVDRQVGPQRAMVPKDPTQARAYGQMISLLTGSLEKGVATLYEIALRPEDKRWTAWAYQCRGRLVGGLLEAELRASEDLLRGGLLFGGEPTHADVAGVLAFELAKALAPGEMDAGRAPCFAALAAGFGTRPEFEKMRAG